MKGFLLVYCNFELIETAKRFRKPTLSVETSNTHKFAQRGLRYLFLLVMKIMSLNAGSCLKEPPAERLALSHLG